MNELEIWMQWRVLEKINSNGGFDRNEMKMRKALLFSVVVIVYSMWQEWTPFFTLSLMKRGVGLWMMKLRVFESSQIEENGFVFHRFSLT